MALRRLSEAAGLSRTTRAAASPRVPDGRGGFARRDPPRLQRIRAIARAVGDEPRSRRGLPSQPYFASAYADVHDGAADLYVYFYREGVELLRPGGRLSFIVTNKWLRAGYGAGLRRFFSERAVVESIVDFGHAPIFPDADVFPCIVIVERPGEPNDISSRETMVTLVPREALGNAIRGYVSANAYAVPFSRLGAEAWSLEPAEVQTLMDKIRAAGVPLSEAINGTSLRGILTGFNQAYVIDTSTRTRLIEQDSNSRELIQPLIRGQDTERWATDPKNLWLIVIASSDNRSWPWTDAPKAAAERLFQETYPGIFNHLKQFESQLIKRQDKGRYWWELRSCAYYGSFAEPKILYPDITWSSQFSVDEDALYCTNTVYFLPTGSLWMLSVLNSPLMWYYCWRTAVHGKDEALRLFRDLIERLPIANPTPAIREEAEASARRLIELTNERRQLQTEFADWLRTEHGIEKPGQKLEAFDELASDDFVAAVRDRLPKKGPSLGPRQVAELRKHHADYGPRLQENRAVAAGLERRLSHLVNQAYGLTEAEVELMWRTAPPRMPVWR